MKIFKFDLGQKVQEKFTGFEGVVMAQTRYFNGCLKYGILPIKLDKDGQIIDWEWIDEQQLRGKKSLLEKKIDDSERPGGPQFTPPSD